MPDLAWLIELPHYRYGVTLFGVLAILPALVSGNMLLHAATRVRQEPASYWRMLVGNAVLLLVCVGVMAIALWQWL